MNIYKKGDIIVKDNYTYVCRIVGETEAYFEPRWFKYLFNTPQDNGGAISGSGSMDSLFTPEKSLIIFSQKQKLTVSQKENEKSFYDPYKYPVIGSSHMCSLSIELYVIKNNYPEAYEKYIEGLASDLLKSKESKVILKKIKTKKK